MIEWLKKIAATEVPPADVVAFNVGLFKSDNGYMAYLTGAKTYDPEDDDWACEEDFTPADRYCAIPAKGADETWEQVRDRAIDELRNFLASSEGQASFLARAEAVTVGFDDGDLVRVV